MWQDYFVVKGIQPGRVVTPRHGILDFSKPNLSINTLKELFDDGFPYLKLTDKGKNKLYGSNPEEKTESSSETKKDEAIPEIPKKENQPEAAVKTKSKNPPKKKNNK